MKVIIRGKGVVVTNSMENYVQEKVRTFIDKYFADDAEVVEVQGRMKVEKLKHFAEITIHFHSYVLRGEASSTDMYVSIDEAIKKIVHQYTKHKERLSRKHKVPGMKAISEPAPKGEDEMEVIRRKKFTLKPMGEEEAIMQMELLGHNFYVFLDADTNAINVVYKRKEGFFGVIETDR